ncbi:MAG: serine/threonine protein kinase [Thermoleophilaceae bacterium]|nr:serine/threonine protein kinase [Thermoleophilaceae bacterium]
MSDAAERSSWDLSEGDAIAPGLIALDQIGGGSLYEAYLAWDEELFALVVAKVVRPGRAAEERSLRELRDEAAMLAELAHPMIVRGFGAVLDGERPHLVIEHLEGPSLRRLLRQGGPLSAQQLLPVALHLAGALAYLANRSVVHLDVKPDNVIVGVPPRLIDLSIARSLERAARSRGPLGTDAYMAPEQCGVGGSPAMGSAADVWGLGATLHHCVTGERPFPRPDGAGDSRDPDLRFPQLSKDPGPLPDHLPTGLGPLIGSMLSRDPLRRPTAAAVADALEPMVAELPRKLTFSRRAARL